MDFMVLVKLYFHQVHREGESKVVCSLSTWCCLHLTMCPALMSA
ncbi:hypothetical protein Nmel_013222 [Mimus melanotis]